jgi:hypothetical protein
MAKKGALVADDDWLFRRVLKGNKFIDKKSGNPTSRAFALREVDNNELSVDAKSLTTANVSIDDPKKYRLFEISHIQVKECNVVAYHDPLQNNEAHSVIKGEDFVFGGSDVIPGLLARRAVQVPVDEPTEDHEEQ